MLKLKVENQTFKAAITKMLGLKGKYCHKKKKKNRWRISEEYKPLKKLIDILKLKSKVYEMKSGIPHMALTSLMEMPTNFVSLGTEQQKLSYQKNKKENKRFLNSE